ncbi:MAG: tyrosine-type recombinase/integrase [Anaerolineae bacterium]|jgi:site-specific recombinase XerD
MDKNGITLSQAIEGYFVAAHARRLSRHTLRDYDTTFRRFETFLGRDPPLAKIGTAQVTAFLGSLDHISAKTLLNYHTGLAALWTWAVKEGIVDQRIVHRVERPKPEQREILPYTRRDLQVMLVACDHTSAYVRPGKRKSNHSRPTADCDRAIILLLVDTGMRASELCNLRIRDLDMANHRVHVMEKGRKERLLPIAACTSQAIWRHLVTRDDAAPKAFLFPTSEGTRLSRHSLRRMLKRTGDRAGIRGANVHRFRHTFAIQLLRNGGNIFALKRMLGHSSLKMVDVYLDIAQADVESAHQQASPVTNWGL